MMATPTKPQAMNFGGKCAFSAPPINGAEIAPTTAPGSRIRAAIMLEWPSPRCNRIGSRKFTPSTPPDDISRISMPNVNPGNANVRTSTSGCSIFSCTAANTPSTTIAPTSTVQKRQSPFHCAKKLAATMMPARPAATNTSDGTDRCPFPPWRMSGTVAHPSTSEMSRNGIIV